MRILHKDTLLNSEYTDNMYSYNDQLCNKGGLTLVSPEYYNFADSIMTKIRSYATFESLDKYGNDLLLIIDKRIVDDLQLQNQFIEFENDIKIANEIMLKFYKQIWKKVLYARFKALIKQYTESNTGHYAKNGSNVSHRTSFKTMVKKNSVNNTSKSINIIRVFS